MKKILLSGVVILMFIAYVFHQKFEDQEEANIIVPASLNTPSAITNTRQTQMMGGSSMPMMHGTFKNGEYTGSVADAYYGPLQVKAVITNGQISDVQFLQYPNDRQTSVEINTQAMPYLTQEAIKAQSSNVDGVSGATQTSRAFKESLQSALSQAN